jgi:lipopolysaccharide export system protein LptA
VEILFSDMTAAADRAEYFSAKETLVLSGDKASVRRTEAVVTGSKITVLRGQERVRVEGSEQKQMEAVFYPQGDGFFPSTEK